ncbi:hypothetical protein JXA88_13095, partial [Candidatus Fermentibacteria bacterium]|nr:hypothetical protein [Candidatus Fermentibacteria bacterium]
QVKFYPNGVTSPGYEMNPFHLSGAVDIVVRCSDEITGGGSNAGVYTVGYEVFDGSGANMVSVRGPVYNLYFDYWWWNNYLPYIYTDQSSTTVYYYIATNGLGYDSWLDVSTLPNVVGPYNDGYYTIKVYAGDIDQGFAEHAVDVRVPELGANEVTMTIQNKFRRPLGPDLDGGVVEVNDTQYPSPFPMICSPGQTVELTAVSPQTINGKRYIFNYWNDGYDEPTRVVQASESTYTAYFSTRAHTKPADNDDVDVTASIPQTPDPTVFSLSDGAPNPFGTETTISYSLEKCAPTTIRLYDSSWQLVRVLVDENRSAGRHTVCWDGRDEQGRATPSGVYFCRMEAGSFSATSRLVLVR